MFYILFTFPTCWSLKLKRKSLLNRKVLQPDTHDRESCPASYRELSLAAELVAILSFCTESGHSEWSRMMGEGVLCSAQCAVTLECEVYQRSFSQFTTLFTCLCWLLYNAFLRLDFRQSCWNISPLVFTIRNLLSLQEAYLQIWNQSKKGLLTVVRMRQHLSVLLELYSVKYPLEYTGQISLPSEYCIFPHTSDSLLNC